jgi:hypothetical protein
MYRVVLFFAGKPRSNGNRAMPKETLSVTNNAFTKPAIIVDASGSPRKNPASSANLLNQFFSAQKIFLSYWVELFIDRRQHCE